MNEFIDLTDRLGTGGDKLVHESQKIFFPYFFHLDIDFVKECRQLHNGCVVILLCIFEFILILSKK